MCVGLKFTCHIGCRELFLRKTTVGKRLCTLLLNVMPIKSTWIVKSENDKEKTERWTEQPKQSWSKYTFLKVYTWHLLCLSELWRKTWHMIYTCSQKGTYHVLWEYSKKWFMQRAGDGPLQWDLPKQTDRWETEHYTTTLFSSDKYTGVRKTWPRVK